jgi:hypothetical protein
VQFKHPPLHPFWHKHFYTSGHFWPNIGGRWGLGNGGNDDLRLLPMAISLSYVSNEYHMTWWADWRIAVRHGD